MQAETAGGFGYVAAHVHKNLFDVFSLDVPEWHRLRSRTGLDQTARKIVDRIDVPFGSMHASDRDDAESGDEALFQSRCVGTMSHRGRVVRLLLALLLSVLGLLWSMPYTGWAHSLVLFGPAAALLVLAGQDRRSRRIIVIGSLPTVLGLVLGLVSFVHTALRFPSSLLSILGISLATTLFAVIAASPRVGSP